MFRSSTHTQYKYYSKPQLIKCRCISLPLSINVKSLRWGGLVERLPLPSFSRFLPTVPLYFIITQTFLKARFLTSLMHTVRGDLVTGDSNGTVYVWGNGGNKITNIIKHAHDVRRPTVNPHYLSSTINSINLELQRYSCICHFF